MSRPADYYSDEDEYDSEFEAFGFEPVRNRVHNVQELVQSPEEKLFAAVQKENPTSVKAAIDEGADIHFRIRDNSAIMEAAFQGHFDVMELLLKNGANVNDEHHMNNVMMHLCMSWSKREEELLRCLKLLLEYNADPKATNWTLVTPLVLAVKHNHILLVTHLLEIGCDVNSADSDGITPLITAAKEGNLDMVKLLLDAGANPHVMDRWGNGLEELPQVSSNPALAALLGIKIDVIVEEFRPTYLSNYKMAMLPVPKKTDRMYGYHGDAARFVRGIGLYDVAHIFEDRNIQLAELLTWNDDEWKRCGVNISYYIRKIELAVKKYHEHPWGKDAIPKVEKVIVDDEVDLFAVVQFFLDFLRMMHISSATSFYLLKYSEERLNAESTRDIDKMLRYNSLATQQLQSIKKIIRNMESEASAVPPDLVPERNPLKLHLTKQNSGFGLKLISFVSKLTVFWRLSWFSDLH